MIMSGDFTLKLLCCRKLVRWYWINQHQIQAKYQVQEQHTLYQGRSCDEDKACSPSHRSKSAHSTAPKLCQTQIQGNHRNISGR